MDPITIRHPFAPARPSLAAAAVADLFGLTGNEPPHTVADNLTLDVSPRDVVLFTGPSGGGKSSLLREVGRRLGAVDSAALDLPPVPLVEALPGELNERLATLAACGLAEARVLLRTPGELSDGQRARFRLAYAFAVSGDKPVMADEFGALLDRTLAKVVAFGVRKLATRKGVGLLAATTHTDLSDDLSPDVAVECRGDGDVRVTRAEGGAAKKPSGGSASSGSPTAPDATGRTSLGGITAAAWASPAAS